MAAAAGPLWSERQEPGDPSDIGRQLHDIVVPQLFVLTTGLAALQRHPDRTGDGQLVDDLVETAAQALADLRAISRGRSLALGGPLGLVADRLAAATGSVAELSGCTVSIDVDGRNQPIEPDLDHDVRAVVWEAIANAMRHGNAGRVWVALSVTGGRLHIGVTDDGTWRSGDARGTGLMGLERRAVTRGGRFGLEHAAGGTRLEWEVPLVTSPAGIVRR